MPLDTKKNTRVEVPMSHERKAVLAAFAGSHGLSLAELIREAINDYMTARDIVLPADIDKPGGWRGRTVDVDRIEVKLRGLPPLADDD